MGCDSLTKRLKRREQTERARDANRTRQALYRQGRLRPVVYALINPVHFGWTKIGKCSEGGRNRLAQANVWDPGKRNTLAWTIDSEAGSAAAEQHAHDTLIAAGVERIGEWYRIHHAKAFDLIVAALSTSETDNANSSESTDGSRKEPAQL
jgi:hypothetical protein